MTANITMSSFYSDKNGNQTDVSDFVVIYYIMMMKYSRTAKNGNLSFKIIVKFLNFNFTQHDYVNQRVQNDNETFKYSAGSQLGDWEENFADFPNFIFNKCDSTAIIGESSSSIISADTILIDNSDDSNKATNPSEDKLIMCATGGNSFAENYGFNPPYPMVDNMEESSTESSEESESKDEEISEHQQHPNAEQETDSSMQPNDDSLTLSNFADILKNILPDNWALSLDRKYGIQIIKMHMDDCLNPSIMISVVVSNTDKIIVNVRGKRLKKVHKLFADLGDFSSVDSKFRLCYILELINKLELSEVCAGCDDMSLKMYWRGDGFIDTADARQTYRSRLCELLVRSGEKRCYRCFRLNKFFKMRKRRALMLQKEAVRSGRTSGNTTESGTSYRATDIQLTVHEILEEAFVNMEQRLSKGIMKIIDK